MTRENDQSKACTTPDKSDLNRERSIMARGTIQRLIADRGYGLIRTERTGVFFHRSDLRGVAYESLVEGQQVEFETIRTAKGQKAVNVRLSESR